MSQAFLRFLKNSAHKIGALSANIRYGFPSKHMRVIGVTGTDGKTTTCHIIYHILKSAGKNVSLTTSVYTDIGGDISSTGLHVTTQNHWLLQKNMKKARNAGSEFFILETTSHAIHQHRVWGVDYDIAVLTNITPEHLDYHKTFNAYLRTKVQLLLRAKQAVINADDSSYDEVRSMLQSHKAQYCVYSRTGKEGAEYTWKKSIETPIKGDFNKDNILAAYACCMQLGIPAKDIEEAIASFVLPAGRLERVYNKNFSLYIDFAHTPNSIRKLLMTLKDLTDNRLIHVFGSAGLRDAVKRPDMGKASAEYADVVILTEEDYRTESFTTVTNAISKGLFEMGFSYLEPEVLAQLRPKESKKRFTIVKNRQRALDYAVSIAQKGDVVVATGKGHEASLARGTREYPWDEHRAFRRALRVRKRMKQASK